MITQNIAKLLVTIAALPLIAGCQQTAAEAPPQDAAAAVHALLEGLGPSRPCQSDRDCGGGGQLGACVLSTCFGILTTDSRPARRGLVARLAAAPEPVRSAAVLRLEAALHGLSSGPAVRLAAVEAIGAVARVRPMGQVCGKPCELLKLQGDDQAPIVAAAVRVELGSLGEASVLPGLLQDVTGGTELLRTESCRGLAGYAGTAEAAAARDALLVALQDRSPVVHAAAFMALRPWAKEPAVRVALRQLVQGRAPHLAYALDKLEAAPATP